MTNSPILHQAPFEDWYATQDAVRGVWLCNRADDEKVKVEPPLEWGRKWRWNVVEDGTGIYFRNDWPYIVGSLPGENEHDF
jgi:hypothetical protein